MCLNGRMKLTVWLTILTRVYIWGKAYITSTLKKIHSRGFLRGNTVTRVQIYHRVNASYSELYEWKDNTTLLAV